LVRGVHGYLPSNDGLCLPSSNVICVAKIATGEEVEDFGADDGKDKAAYRQLSQLYSQGRRPTAPSRCVGPKNRKPGMSDCPPKARASLMLAIPGFLI
jgi:hypothetical protein